MNEQPPRHLVSGLEVLVVGHDEKAHRAKIIEVIHPRAVRVESLDGKSTAVSEYSETGEVNTFSFPSASVEAETQPEAKKRNKN